MEELRNVSGIYMIENTANESIYIGQAESIKYRARKHFETLRINKHRNQHLQYAFNKYGESAFVVHMLNVDIPIGELDSYEQTWLNVIREYPPDRVYNMCFVPGTTRGYKYTEEQCAALSKSLLGLKKSAESRPNYSAASKAKWAAGGMVCKPRKIFKLIDPDGVVHDGVGVAEFAALHNLSAGNISSVLSGKMKQTKGWYKG